MIKNEIIVVPFKSQKRTITVWHKNFEKRFYLKIPDGMYVFYLYHFIDHCFYGNENEENVNTFQVSDVKVGLFANKFDKYPKATLKPCMIGNCTDDSKICMEMYEQSADPIELIKCAINMYWNSPFNNSIPLFKTSIKTSSGMDSVMQSQHELQIEFLEEWQRITKKNGNVEQFLNNYDKFYEDYHNSEMPFLSFISNMSTWRYLPLKFKIVKI